MTVCEKGFQEWLVMNENSNDDSDSDQQCVSVEEKISTDTMISLTEELISGKEQRSFILEQQIMSIYKIKEQLQRERPKHMKDLTLKEMFQNASKQVSKPEPQPSTSGTCVSAAVLSSPDVPDDIS
jgi:hypothetical protein